ncbi:Sir2 family NAD-dependent protein deacetylase [Nocardioides limicola]|uniref:Sir2 family NAD-dependent protein deacetylase n=1 Tax=Nocardioides limicola TaxID=2803368 RepID=UPI00193B501F|nr:Sir2 family NAD-dependent protein deacetylase [Nocardioides sp. DJM-14]
MTTAASTSLTTTLAALADRRLVVLTGAGVSTDSGIPDYRGPGAPDRRPMTFQEFVSSPAAQQRYWARSHLGYQRIGHATPNAGHRALAATPAIDLLITQNVDGLHEASGQQPMVALHGRVSDVVCLDCRASSPRARLQDRLTAANPDFLTIHAAAPARPDGDVELAATASFVVPGCEACGGRLKPDVVFFGENVPRGRVQRCLEAVDALATNGGALLVVGSSLTVMSGLRFVKRAAAAGVDVVIVNRGATRGDAAATLRLGAGCSEFLTLLAAHRRAPARV